MKLESRRERAERLKRQRRSALAGMAIAIVVVVALGIVLWRGKTGLVAKNADYEAQITELQSQIDDENKEVMNSQNMRSTSRRRSSWRRLLRTSSGLYIQMN